MSGFRFLLYPDDMVYCLFEDDVYSRLQPLVHLRPVHELLCGALPLGFKWTAELPRGRVRFLFRESLPRYSDHPAFLTEREVASGEGIWFVNARVLPGPGVLGILKKRHRGSRLYTDGGSTVAAFLTRPEAMRIITGLRGGLPDFRLLDGIPEEPVTTESIDDFWDLIRHNAGEIEADHRRRAKKLRKVRPADHDGVHFVNRKAISIGKKCTLKPGVVLDAGNGPIIIGNRVIVMPNAVVEGPACIGDGTIIKIGAKIYGGTSIGSTCKVGGEVEHSIINDYSNKQHEGFLGHSCLGSWVNLGADTNTSDLKNTYGTVSVSVGGAKRDTGLQFLGLTMGDHSKTGINVMFDTGSVVGTSCNIYGAGVPPKEIPSFSWGGAEGLVTYRIDQGLETMRRVMTRRGVMLTEEYAAAVGALFSATAEDRERAGVK